MFITDTDRGTPTTEQEKSIFIDSEISPALADTTSDHSADLVAQ
jgi:hypothetical protein